jgi:hypothetical protein
MNEYHPDKPINYEKEDLFNRISFANNVVEILSGLNENESYVIGLYAKWGFGKTSTINLINELFDKRNNVCLVNVNAWMFDGNTEKIIWNIFEGVSRGINYAGAKSTRRILGEKIKSLSKAKFPFDLDTAIDINNDGKSELVTSSGKIINTMNFIGQLLLSSDNINKARGRIEKCILESKKKVVVFIDDIDRLTSQQIINLFRTISSISDYSGITYILPFDKEFVCAAIEESLPHGQSGEDYLEKIIQIPLHLPMIPQGVIDNVFTSKLVKLLNNHSISIDEKEGERFRELYYRYGINSYIKSPRDINKITNSFHFTLPINNGEANVVDTVILEIIRVFDEAFYNKIKNNKSVLIMHADNILGKYLFDENNVKRKADIEKIFGNNIDDFHFTILKQLFPIVESVCTNSAYIDNNNLRKLQRIASAYYFDIFFASFDEQTGISDRKIIFLLNNATDKEIIADNLKIINASNYDIALRTISDNSKLIDNQLGFCEALLDLVETLPKHRKFLQLSALDRILFTIDDILAKSNTKLNDYTALLQYNYEHNRIHTIPFLIKQVIVYSSEERARNGNIILNENELPTYKKSALEIIRDMAKKDKLPISESTNNIFWLYGYWAEFGSKQETSEYIKAHIKSTASAIDFISQFLGRWTGENDDSYRRGDLNASTYEIISKLIDPKYLYDIIIADEEYGKFIDIDKTKLISFENSFDNEIKEVAKAGNEHTDKFRLIVAQRLIYFHENAPAEADNIADEHL